MNDQTNPVLQSRRLDEPETELAQACEEIARLEDEQQQLRGQVLAMELELERLRQGRVEQVEQEKEKFRSLFEQSLDGIFMVDLQGRIVEWNASLEEITGRKRAEVLGRSVAEVRTELAQAELRTPGKIEHLRELTLSALNPMHPPSIHGVVEGLIERPDGVQRTIQELIFPIRTNEGAMLCGIIRDITERKQAEAQEAAAQQALAASQQRLQALFEYSLDAIVLTDDNANFVDANPAACELFATTLEELSSSTVCDITPVPDRRKASHRFQEFLAQGQQEGSYSVVRKDGTLIDVEYCAVANIQPGLHMSIIRDVTERKRAEEALRESELLHRSLFENSSDGIMLTAPDGQVFSANPAACAMLGRSEEEICALGRAGVVDPTDPRLPVLLEERARSGRARGQLTFIHKEGARFQVDISSNLFLDKDGEIRTSMIFRDVSEQARALRLLEQRVQERTRELTALLEISRNVTSTLDLEPLLQVILEQLRTVLDYTGAGILILDGDHLVLSALAGALDWKQEAPLRIPLDLDLPLNVVVKTQAPFIVGDLRQHEKWAQAIRAIWYPSPDEAHRLSPSWLGVPLISKGKLIGVLRIDHAEPQRFTEDDARLALAIANQAALAIDNARLYQEAKRAAALEERQRLARDLHDSISQALYGIVLGARTARAQLEAAPLQAAEALDYVLSLANSSFAEMRALIFELLPNSVETQGLTTAITRYVEVLRVRHGLRIEMHLAQEPAVAMEVKETLYRITQEALNNVTKHAAATDVQLRLFSANSSLRLTITDNGSGFDAAGAFPGHLGLQSMRQRAESVGGAFELESTIGEGTCIYVEVPLAGNEAAQGKP